MKQHPSTILVLVLFAVLGSALLSGCNTVRGVGRDIERTGERIGDATR
jgi:predicted small secreted protein